MKTNENKVEDFHKSYYLLYTDLQTYCPPDNHKNARSSDENMNATGFVLVLGYKIQEDFNHQRVRFQGVSDASFPKSGPNFNTCARSLSYFGIKLSLPNRTKTFKSVHASFEEILLFKGFSCALEI